MEDIKFVPKSDNKGYKMLGSLKNGRKKVAEIKGAYVANGTYNDKREEQPTYCYFSVKTSNRLFCFEGTLEDCIKQL